jgi:uncharacterized protein
MQFKSKYGPWAVVTGASSGIGLEICHELARRGLNIVAVARNEELLNLIKTELESTCAVEVRPLVLDLGISSSLAKLLEETRELDIGLVVPCAGTVEVGDFAKIDLSAQQCIVQLNVVHPLSLTHAFSGKFIERKRGGVLLVSSTFGFQGVPYFATYAASKAFILALAEALRFELEKFDIDVAVLSPGLTATNMTKRLPIDFRKLPMVAMTAKEVAEAGVGALHRKATAVPGLINKIFVFMNRLTPRKFPVVLLGFMIKNAFDKPHKN